MIEEIPKHPKQLKPKISFELLDWNGNLVRNGDRVRVYVPKCSLEESYTVRPALILFGLLHATLSKGILLKVTGVRYPEGGANKYSLPKVWELKYCKHRFVKI